METKVTVAADVALPFEDVQLKYLRTKSGGPVVVRCESVGELALLEAFEVLPGGVPPIGIQDEPESDPVALMRQLEGFAPALIERGTTFVDAGGAEVRPAFYFDESRDRHEFSIPGRLLRAEDVLALVNTIMRLGGYGGGAADEAAFPDGNRKGLGDGVGAGPVLPGVSHDAARGAA